jgi:uncharacterized membrane protein YbaN (DUF454 family)
MRLVFVVLGLFSLAIGFAGVFLPLLPTVPFVILAAFCFARGSSRLERWLLEHRTFGPHIHSWRSEGAISRGGKRAAYVAMAMSAVVGFLSLPGWWALAPAFAGIIAGGWIWRLPTSERNNS